MDLTEEEITKKLPDLRTEFEEKFKEQLSGDTYDGRDVTRFREDDTYAKCFIRSFVEKDGDLKEALDHVDQTFVFRKSISLNDLKEDSFPSELKERDFLYWKGVNNQDQKILYFKVVKHKKGQMVEEVKRFIAYYFDKYQREETGRRIVLIFDFTGAGVTNMDMDIVKYIISCFSNYFPSLLSYILLFEMPMLLSAAWKIIQTWLSESQKKKIKLVKKKDMPNYINDDQLEPHMLKK